MALTLAAHVLDLVFTFQAVNGFYFCTISVLYTRILFCSDAKLSVMLPTSAKEERVCVCIFRVLSLLIN